MHTPRLPDDPLILQRALDSSVTGVVIVDARQPDYPLIYVNPAFEAMTGYTAAEVLGRNCRFLQGPDRTQPARHALRHAIHTGTPITAVLINHRKDGDRFLNELTLSPIRDASGTVTHIVGFQQDVTDREHARQHSAAVTRHLQATLNHLPDPFIAYDQQWTITYVNAAAATLFNHPPEQLIGQPLHAVNPHADRLPVIQAAQHTLATGVTQRLSLHSDHLDRELDATIYATPDGTAVLLRDVTAARQAQQALQDSEDLFSKIFRASPVAIAVSRQRDGHIVDVNPAFLTLTGYEKTELTDQPAQGLHLWFDLSTRPLVLEQLHAHDQLVDQMIALRLKSGDIIDAAVSIVPVTIAGEACMLSLIRDVTTERRAQQRLEASEQAARTLAADLQRTLDQSPDMIVSVDAQGQFVTVSAAATRILGYPPHDLIGQPFFTYVHPDDRAYVSSVIAQARTQQELRAVQYRFRHRDGHTVWLEWSSIQHLDGTYYGVARDITQQRAAAEDQAFLAAIVHTSTDAILGLSLDGTIRSWNTSAEHLFGYTTAQALGQPITLVVPTDLRGSALDFLEQVRAGARPIIDTVRLTRDGTRVHVQIRGAPIHDAAGHTIGISGIIQDVTSRREAEQQILRLNTDLHRKVGHLTSLRAIDQAITSSLDLPVTLSLVLNYITAQVQADAATALLLTPQADALTYVATRGLHDIPTHVPLHAAHTLAGRVAITRELTIVHDLRHPTLDHAGTTHLLQAGFTAYAGVPLLARGKVLGVIEVIGRRPFDTAPDWLDVLQTLAAQAAIAIDNAQMFAQLERRNLELRLAYDATIEGWAHALDLRDKETEGHARRVTEMTVTLCTQLGFTPEQLVHVRRGALLHDIGKMGVPDAILLKPGPLTPDEWREMRKHPGYAVDLLHPIEFLRPALDIPHYHHEKWDGSGYPHGLAGHAIPLAARAFAVVDVYDALTNDRPYRAAWTHDRALTHIRQQSGTHFDPAVVDAFLRLPWPPAH